MVKNTTPIQPTFKTTEDKYIYGMHNVEMLTEAFVYKDLYKTTIDGLGVELVSSIKTDAEWTILVRIDYEKANI